MGLLQFDMMLGAPTGSWLSGPLYKYFDFYGVFFPSLVTAISSEAYFIFFITVNYKENPALSIFNAYFLNRKPVAPMPTRPT